MTEHIIKTNADLKNVLDRLEHEINVTSPLVLTLEEYDPDRNLSQNGLMWIRNRRVSKETGKGINYVHAISKRDVLLPYMLGVERHHARAKMISDDIKGNAENLSLLKVFDLVRSSDLSVAEFAEYMDMYQMYWGLNAGIVLKDSVSKNIEAK